MRTIDYGKITRRSWEITKANKWLWVFGLVIAVFGGGGSSGGSSGSSGGSSGSTFQKSVPVNPPQQLQEKATKVLGDATNIFLEWAKTVPWTTWFFIGLGVLIVAIFSAVVVWVVRTWARGALIAGLDNADRGKTVSLLTESPKGIAKIKPLILFDLINAGILLGLIVASVALVGGGFLIFSFVSWLQILWIILTGILSVFAFIVAIVLLSLTTVFAERLIVFTETKPWPAWEKGFSLARHEFLATFLMGCINLGIGCAGGCLATLALLIVLGIPGFFIAMPMFTGGFHAPNAAQIIALLLLFFIFLSANLLVRTILVVFNYGNWNLFFRQIVKEDHV